MKSLHILIVCMMFAWVLNFESSLKYPVSTLSFLSVLVSTLLIWQLVYMAWHGLFEKWLKVYLMVGIVSVLSFAVLDFFEAAMMGNSVGYYISALRIPLFVLFDTPFFGLNFYFEMSYREFSITLARLFVAIIVLTVIRSKLKENRPIIEE